MSIYNYRIYYDNGSVSEILRCDGRIDILELTRDNESFFRINFTVREKRKRSITINAKKVVYIDEWESEEQQ